MRQKQRLCILLILLAVSGASFYVAYSIPQYRYWQQFAYVVASVSLLISLVMLRKYLKTRYGKKLRMFFIRTAARIRSAMRKAIDRICKKLGIKRRAFYRGVGDSYSFAFSRENDPTGVKRVFSSRPRWRDMETNAMKIRFLYLRYIVRQIKKGFGFKNSDTARQVAKKLSNGSNETLFTLYESVRYADFNGVTDDEVEYCKKLKQ